MNEGISDYKTGIDILERETAVLRKIAALQDSVRTAVMNRDWADFELLLNALQEYGDQFESLESERVRFFSVPGETSPGNDENVGFYALTTRLPEAERTALTAAYRTLKMETLRMRLINNSLTEYLNEARTAVAAFLEAVFPDRKGRLYSRRGIQRPADMRSMVLNHSF
ncbi:hypothetical protein LQZ21_02555 [Treponema sp. TIM-1]|uniref:hypothetical protein n=1 Tax=Treponema sp. TIM-1 TaxID=2898417 RepID=UPI0039818FF2